jgi:hypothetical protein
VPDELLLIILADADYDIYTVGRLTVLNTTFVRLMSAPSIAANVARMLLMRVVAPTATSDRQLNVDRILDIVARGRHGLKGALRTQFLDIARNAHHELHSALLVRAPHLQRASGRFPADATVGAAALLFAALRPSVVRAIESERVHDEYFYVGLGDAEMEYVVSRIGREQFVNQLVVGRRDTTFRRAVQAYVAEISTPLGRRMLLARYGPLCFWDTSGIQDMHKAFDSRQDLRGRAFRNAVSPRLYSFTADLMWPTQSVLSMDYAFAFSLFNGQIGHWNVSSVRSMRKTFVASKEFNADISEWDVSGVEDMTAMFKGAESFAQSIEAWDMRSVVAQSEMMHTDARGTWNDE